MRLIRKGWPTCPGITPWWAGCHPLEHCITIADIGRSALVTARSLASSREGSAGLYARAAALQTGSPPSRGLHLIGSIQPVRSIRASREDLTRSVGGDSGLKIGGTAHIQRFACERHTRPGAVVPTSQTTSPATAHCWCFSPRWSAFWAPRRTEPRPHRPEPRSHHPEPRPHHPEPRPHHHQTGAIAL